MLRFEVRACDFRRLFRWVLGAVRFLIWLCWNRHGFFGAFEEVLVRLGGSEGEAASFLAFRAVVVVDSCLPC